MDTTERDETLHAAANEVHVHDVHIHGGTDVLDAEPDDNYPTQPPPPYSSLGEDTEEEEKKKQNNRMGGADAYDEIPAGNVITTQPPPPYPSLGENGDEEERNRRNDRMVDAPYPYTTPVTSTSTQRTDDRLAGCDCHACCMGNNDCGDCILACFLCHWLWPGSSATAHHVGHVGEDSGGCCDCKCPENPCSCPDCDNCDCGSCDCGDCDCDFCDGCGACCEAVCDGLS